jgi:hypothetical protein
VSPTVFREAGFTFSFYSREEPRIHIHVRCSDGHAKFWLEPAIALAQNAGLSKLQLRKVEALVKAHADEIRKVWREHLAS